MWTKLKTEIDGIKNRQIEQGGKLDSIARALVSLGVILGVIGVVVIVAFCIYHRKT